MILRKGKDDRNGGEDAPSIKIFVRMGLLLYGLYVVQHDGVAIVWIVHCTLRWGCYPTSTDDQVEQCTVTDPPDTISPPTLPLFISYLKQF